MVFTFYSDEISIALCPLSHAHIYIYTSTHQTYHTHTHITHITRGLGWRIHCGVEVTESSTIKQHISLTWGAAVPQGYTDELQSSVVPDEHAPSRCAGGVGGDAIDEREPVDNYTGDAVGNHKVPKRTIGKVSQNSEHSTGCFAAVISHHDIVYCWARLAHNTHSLQSTAASSEDDKKLNKKSNTCPGRFFFKKNRYHLPWGLQWISEDPAVVASSLTPARGTPNVSHPSRLGKQQINLD